MAEHETFSRAFMIPAGEPITGRTYRADGWAYHDMLGRWLNHDDWNAMVDAIGDDHIAFLAVTRKGFATRGQFLVSPEKHPLVAGFLERSKDNSRAAEALTDPASSDDAGGASGKGSAE